MNCEKSEQTEMTSITDQVDLEEAEKRHKDSMARRWFFGYYLKCADQTKKMKLIDQYNLLARERTKQ